MAALKRCRSEERVLGGSQITLLCRKTCAALVIGCMSVAASPVLANTSAASVEMTEPLRQAQDESLTTGDQGFRQLFASWEELEDAGPDANTLGPIVSVPSRMPLEGARLTSDFGMRSHPVLGGRRKHKGIDLAAPTGTPVYATADGIVDRADWFSSYGLYVEIEHGAELETRYAHMSRLAVAEGERVQKGDIIGYVGSTGRSTGPHLHYEVRIAGVAVSPIPYMVESTVQQELAVLDGVYAEGGQGGD